MKLTNINQYTIKVAVNIGHQPGQTVELTVEDISKSLQWVYDEGNIDGLFSIEMIGPSLAIISFARDEGTDTEAVGCEMLTAQLALSQLAKEFREVYRIEDLDSRHMVRQIVDALERGEASVAGLLEHQPRLRLTVDLLFRTPELRDMAALAMNKSSVAQALIEYFTFEKLLSCNVNVLVPGAQPAEPEPVEQTPARVVMDLTGGVVQWALADVPVDFVIVDDDAVLNPPKGQAVPNQVYVTDTDGVQVKAYPPQHMDIDRAVVDRFFEQTQEK